MFLDQNTPAVFGSLSSWWKMYSWVGDVWFVYRPFTSHEWLASGEFGGPAFSFCSLTFTEGRTCKIPANISVAPSVGRWCSSVDQSSERTQQTFQDFPYRDVNDLNENRPRLNWGAFEALTAALLPWYCCKITDSVCVRYYTHKYPLITPCSH